MKRAVLVAVVLWASAASAASPELHRLAASLALAIAPKNAAPPAPSPTPSPVGKVCAECAPDGHPMHPGHPGKVGDGTIFMDCPNPECPYKPAAPAPAAKAAPLTSTVKAERYAVPPRDGRTYRKVCRDGVCAWEPVQ